MIHRKSDNLCLFMYHYNLKLTDMQYYISLLISDTTFYRFIYSVWKICEDEK
jgi:hypothetical protein